MPINASMLNMANEGFGSGRTIGYTLSWIDAVVWAVGRIGWLNGQRVGSRTDWMAEWSAGGTTDERRLYQKRQKSHLIKKLCLYWENH